MFLARRPKSLSLFCSDQGINTFIVMTVGKALIQSRTNTSVKLLICTLYNIARNADARPRNARRSVERPPTRWADATTWRMLQKYSGWMRTAQNRSLWWYLGISPAVVAFWLKWIFYYIFIFIMFWNVTVEI